MTFRMTGVLLFAAACALPTDAWADLRFCNRSGANVDLAIAYVLLDDPGTTTNGHRGVTIRGWWELTPGECAKVSSIDVSNHEVFFYADSGSGVWQGASMLCVPQTSHTIGGHFRRQGEACPQGNRLRGFKRINSNTRNYTMNLNG